ncbi:MAG: hypothetical protein ACODAB_04835, partial [Gemmatimonadota bacterium]
IGRLEANTALMGWSRTPEGRATLLRVMRDMTELRKSTMFLHMDDQRGFGDTSSIDVWWGGRGGNAELMLLLAHVIRLNGVWGNALLRVLRVVDSEEGIEPSRRHMEGLLEDVRVDATPEIIVRTDPSGPLADLIATHSRATDLTLLGMQKPERGTADPYGERLQELVDAVGTVLLVHNGQPRRDLLSAD